MKQFVVLSVILSLAFFNGCAKKSETENINLDTDESLEDTLTNAMEDVSMTNMSRPQMPEGTAPADASSAENSVSQVPIPENPASQQIQQALKNAGLYGGSIDGSIGPKTKKAIEEFQAQNNLQADGKVGSKTWTLLSQHLTSAPATVKEKKR